MAREFKGIWIPKDIWLSKELSVLEKLFYVEIDSLDGEDGCYASNAYFAEFFDLSKNRCSEIIKSLEEKGYISVQLLYKKGTKCIEKRVLRITNSANREIEEGSRESEEPIREIDRGIRNIDSPYSETRRGYSENWEDNNIFNNTLTNNTDNNKDILSDSPKSNKPYEEIIQYLNQQTKKEFRNTKANQTLINGRLKDGFSVDDFKTVIDIKTSEWLNDPKMNEYLRPKTLFSPSNFEGYLNQKRKDSGANGDERLGKENAKSLSEWDLEELRKARELFEKYGDELEEVDF